MQIIFHRSLQGGPTQWPLGSKHSNGIFVDNSLRLLPIHAPRIPTIWVRLVFTIPDYPTLFLHVLCLPYRLFRYSHYYGMFLVIIGHAGDYNVHSNLFLPLLVSVTYILAFVIFDAHDCWFNRLDLLDRLRIRQDRRKS